MGILAVMMGGSPVALAQVADQPPPQIPAEIPDAAIDAENPRPVQNVARPWTITPWGSVEESVTDNVRLTSSDRQADLISALTPGLHADGQTKRLNGVIDTSVTYDRYLRTSDLNGFEYKLHGDGNATLLEDYLFLDLRSAIDQQPLDRGGSVSAEQRTLSSNQAQIFNNSVSPYLHHDFGTWGGAELRYRLSAANFSDANVGNQPITVLQQNLGTPNSTITNEYAIHLYSGEALSRLHLDLDGDAANTAYDDSDRTVRERSVTGTLEYSVIRELALIGKAGYDSFKDNLMLDQDASNPSWRLGIRLTPGPRTTLSVEGGRRYGGPYWSANFTYKLSPTLRVVATHDITVTTQQQALNAALNGQVINAQGQLVNPLTGLIISPNQQQFSYVSQSYLLHTSQITLSGERGQTSIALSGNYQERDIGALSLSQTPAEKQTVGGIDLSVTHKLNPRSDLRFDLSASRLFDSLGQGDTLAQGTLAYDYKLSPTVSLTTSYSHYAIFNQIKAGSYQENIGIIGIRKEF